MHADLLVMLSPLLLLLLLLLRLLLSNLVAISLSFVSHLCNIQYTYNTAVMFITGLTICAPVVCFAASGSLCNVYALNSRNYSENDGRTYCCSRSHIRALSLSLSVAFCLPLASVTSFPRSMEFNRKIESENFPKNTTPRYTPSE